MLEGLAKKSTSGDEVALRAAMHLVRDHGKPNLKGAILEAVQGKHEAARGVALAALWDIGEKQLAQAAAEVAQSSAKIGTVTWGALVSAAADGKYAPAMVLEESTFRRVQWGWVE